MAEALSLKLLTYFFFFLPPPPSSSSVCLCVCCRFSLLPRVHMESGSNGPPPQAASRSSLLCSQEEAKREGWHHLSVGTWCLCWAQGCSFQSRIYPFFHQKIAFEGLEALVHEMFIARDAGHAVVSRVACMQSYDHLPTHFTKPVWAILWDPGVEEKPKWRTAVKFLLMLLVCLCHITWCCTSLPQHRC